MRRASQMRCLMVVEDWPLTRDSPGGAAALNLSHLELLADTVAAVDLLILADPRSEKGWRSFVDDQPDVWADVQRLCASWRLIEMRLRREASAPLRHAWWGWQDPARLVIDVQAETALSLQQHVHRLQPDFIWAEHLVPATLIDRFLPGKLWVYSHHDWNWRIKKYRHKGRKLDVKRQTRAGLRRRFEEGLVTRATACVSGSATEGVAIHRLGVELVGYFPASFTPAVERRKVPRPRQTPRIVHLGGMRTTATRLGLERFLVRVWPTLVDLLGGERPEFWVIGELEGASPDLHSRLEQAGAICPGFVADLRTVLRPGDLHILPWEHDTGTRTRVPLVLSHAQVLVAVRAGVACLDELKDGKNCVLTDSLAGMAPVLAELLADRPARHRLARAGLATLRHHWTRRAQRPAMRRFLEQLATKYKSAGGA